MGREDDLRTLASLFAGMDGDVMEAVYDANNGELDRAIDQLLEMTTEIEKSNTAQQDSVHESRKRIDDGDGGGGNDESKKERAWRNPLPEDFLVLKGFTDVDEYGRTEEQKRQIERDEMLARMLSNESFQAELRQHEEFRPYLQQTTSSGSSGSGDDMIEQIQTGWNTLSEAARSKFDELASRFSSAMRKDSGGDYQSISTKSEDDSLQVLGTLMPMGGRTGAEDPSAAARRRSANTTRQDKEDDEDELAGTEMTRMKIS